MKLIHRLRRLEQKQKMNTQLWALFTIGCYVDLAEQQRSQQQLLNDYEANGNPSPTHRIFITEIPSPKVKCEGRFLCAFSR